MRAISANQLFDCCYCCWFFFFLFFKDGFCNSPRWRSTKCRVSPQRGNWRKSAPCLQAPMSFRLETCQWGHLANHLLTLIGRLLPFSLNKASATCLRWPDSNIKLDERSWMEEVNEVNTLNRAFVKYPEVLIFELINFAALTFSSNFIQLML